MPACVSGHQLQTRSEDSVDRTLAVLAVFHISWSVKTHVVLGMCLWAAGCVDLFLFFLNGNIALFTVMLVGDTNLNRQKGARACQVLQKLEQFGRHKQRPHSHHQMSSISVRSWSRDVCGRRPIHLRSWSHCHFCPLPVALSLPLSEVEQRAS